MMGSVCVICDTVIEGTGPVCYLTSEQLVRKSFVLFVDYYNKTSNKQISPSPNLQEYYNFSDYCLNNLLLSPRSTRTRSGYTCCKSCYTALRAISCCDKPPKYAISNGLAIGNPPKYAISNGLAIGSCPTQVVDGISDVICLLITK